MVLSSMAIYPSGTLSANKDCKTRGDNLEGSKASTARLTHILHSFHKYLIGSVTTINSNAEIVKTIQNSKLSIQN